MLLVRLLKHSLVVQQLLNFREECLLLIIMVRLDELVPSQAISHEIRLVRIGDVRRLLVNAVVAAEDGVVQQRHVAGTRRKQISLLGLVDGRAYELHGPVGPGLLGVCVWCGGHHEGRLLGEERDEDRDKPEEEGGGEEGRHAVHVMGGAIGAVTRR